MGNHQSSVTTAVCIQCLGKGGGRGAVYQVSAGNRWSGGTTWTARSNLAEEGERS